jgi:hypothetical protein
MPLQLSKGLGLGHRNCKKKILKCNDIKKNKKEKKRRKRKNEVERQKHRERRRNTRTKKKTGMLTKYFWRAQSYFVPNFNLLDLEREITGYNADLCTRYLEATAIFPFHSMPYNFCS